MDLGGFEALKNKTGLELKQGESKERAMEGGQGSIRCHLYLRVSRCGSSENEPGGPPPTGASELRPRGPHSENHSCICAKATPPMEDLLPVTCLWVA